MTTEELSNELDVLLNSHSTNNNVPSIILDEYEKSVILTYAQESILRELYNGTLLGESFEETEELRRYLSSLIKTEKLEELTEPSNKIDYNSQFFKLKDDVWFITYEQAVIASSNNKPLSSNEQTVRVIPMRQDEWQKARSNPFKKPNSNKVVRLDNQNNILEVISEYNITEYLIKYIKKPTPIILVNLPEDLSINGESNITECELNNALYRIILERAVQLAYRRIPQASKD